MNDGFNKYYLDALNRIEAARAEMDLAVRHIEAANHRIDLISQRLTNVEKNIHFLKKEWMVVSMYQYSLAKKERKELQDQLICLKNERVRLTFIRDNISLHILSLQQSLPSLRSKVIRMRHD